MNGEEKNISFLVMEIKFCGNGICLLDILQHTQLHKRYPKTRQYITQLQTDSDRSRLIQTDPDRIRLIQTDSNGSRLILT